MIIGIDPGKNGCILGLFGSGKEVRRDITPTIGKELDMHGFLAVIKFYKNNSMLLHAYIEDVHAICGASAGDMFAGVPEIRKPSTRRNKDGDPIRGPRDTKAMALLAAKRLFPSVDLTATERSKKPHDGIVDALLLAEYGRRKSTGDDGLVDLV